MIGTSLLFSGSIGGLISPFDTVAPTAGYSLRALTLSYTGAVVRVRRDGDGAEQDFTPTQITNGDLEAFLNVPAQAEHTVDVYRDLKRGIVPLTKPTQFYNFEDVSLVSDCFTGGSGTMESYDSLFSMVDHNTKVYYDLDFSSLKTDVSLVSPLNSGSSGTLESFTTVNELLSQNDGFVHTWYDQSGNGYHAVQVTDADQPKIWDSVTGLVTENGKPALDFDGVDDSLATTGYIVELSANDASVFAVVNPVVSIYILAEADGESPYSSNFIFGGNVATKTLWVNATDFGSAITGHSLVGFIYDGTNFQAYQDGLADGASGTAIVNTEALNQSVIGARADQTTAFYSGKIQELITYKSDQSANRTAIEDNINNHYDIY